MLNTRMFAATLLTARSRTLVRALAAGLPLIGLAIALSSHGGASPSATEFRYRDDCDPVTFDAAIGPGACIGNGGTTFQKLLRELQEDQTAGAWRINPDQTGLDSGDHTLIVSRGGELHTFTKVEKFGGGIVPLLNDLAGVPQIAPECQINPAAFSPGSIPVFPGSSVPGPVAGTAGLPVGKTKFQCCIHPWMRTVVEVKSHH
ncbi:MAG TPA: hypothetical protein VNY05_16770 [Candidatus Acidoferrales bacterium]|jgi:hypothetical protein|nr:hypothetical protein [Candidatus Acidoferrales bacterium]